MQQIELSFEYHVKMSHDTEIFLHSYFVYNMKLNQKRNYENFIEKTIGLVNSKLYLLR